MIGWAPVRIARRHALPALAKEGKSHPIHFRKLGEAGISLSPFR